MENSFKDATGKRQICQFTILDPEKTIPYDVSNLEICRTCLELTGQFNYELPDKRRRYLLQECNCKKTIDRQKGINKANWPGFDFSTAVELCYCCGRHLIKSGSRYSFFFCQECLEKIKNYNKSNPCDQVSLGRHSFLNGIGLGKAFGITQEVIFIRKLNVFFAGIDRLHEWRKVVLFDNLHDLGFDLAKNVRLIDYDARLKDLGITSESQFKKLIIDHRLYTGKL